MRINSFTYANSGDGMEKQFGVEMNELFNNSEVFWKNVVCPSTNRIIANHNASSDIKFREGIDSTIEEICCFHYSVFINLVYASAALKHNHLSFFENFYTHLASVCDSTEELISKIHLLKLECKGTQSEVLQGLSKKKFILLAQEWYDNHYSTLFKFYLDNGKHPPMKLIGRDNLLEEYFGKFQPWKEFKKFAQLIRQYRNAIVHNYQIGSFQPRPGVFYVPKKEKIQEYKKWNQVFNALNYPSKIKNHFILREEQMAKDLELFKVILHNLWEKPIEDLINLLYKEKNEIVLNKYSLIYVD